jgi:molybdate transport system regulatory protein
MPAPANPTTDLDLTASLVLSRGARARMGADRVALLEAIRDQGSITGAAKLVGLSYKGAWDAIQVLNNLFERPLVAAQPGGRGGGTAGVTAEGLAVITAFHRVQGELAHALSGLERMLRDPAAPESMFWSLAMKTSARNALRGVVSRVIDGAVNAEVSLTVAPGVEITAVITRQSVADLELAPGRAAIALIKSSFIILAAADESLRTSARNRLAGTVSRIEDGAVNCEVTLDLEAGKTLTAIVTMQSARDLGLEVGAPAMALIKASHVILAVEG